MFSATVRELKTVEFFLLDQVIMEDMQPPSVVPLDSLPVCWVDFVMQSLSTLPTLKQLRIIGASDFGSMNIVTNNPPGTPQVVQCQTIRNIAACRNLSNLCLMRFNLTDDNVIHLAQHLQNNNAIRDLEIDFTAGENGARALGTLIAHNKGIRTVYLCVRANHQEAAHSQSSVDQEDVFNLKIAEAVLKSQLTDFGLYRPMLSPRTNNAFRRMISSQYTLLSLTLFTADAVLNKSLREDPHIALYLKMNRFGRRELLTEPSKTNQMLNADVPTGETFVVQTLFSLRDDIACLYYVLREKPSIIETALGVASPPKKIDGGKQKAGLKRCPSNIDDDAPSSKRIHTHCRFVV
jgi:hypothetical protein